VPEDGGNLRLSNKPDKPLNVLFVSHDAHPMGAQNLLLTLAGWLKESRLVNPRFILAGPGSLVEEFLRIGPVLRLDPDGAAKSDADATLRLLRSFCRNDLSAVYHNSAACGHVVNITRHLGVPQIVHVNEMEKSIERWVGPEKMAVLRNYADLFIAGSRPVADNLHERHGISRDRLRVVDAFISSTGIRDISDSEKRSCKAAIGLVPDRKVVLACGTRDWRKAPDLFVDVAKAVEAGGGGPFQFVWVGREGQDYEEFKRSTAGRAKSPVRFVGEVSNLLPFMIAADVFLLPSREDPFPLVCLMAGDCGVPIICFADAGGMPEFVGSTCGVVVPYLDVPAMANAVRSLLADETRSRLLGQQAKAKVREECAVAVKGEVIYKLIREVCEKAGSNGSPHPAF
jgi:glycosyltransferase involved in cell wall biosynthesis